MSLRRDGKGGESQEPNSEHEVGTTLLAYLALLRAGGAEDARRGAWKYSRRVAASSKSTYELSLLLRVCAELFISWPGDADVCDEARNASPLKRVNPSAWRVVQRAALALERNVAGDGMWRYRSGAAKGDISNSQFAMLGLLCAQRLGFRVNTEIVQKATESLVAYRGAGGVRRDWPASITAREGSSSAAIGKPGTWPRRPASSTVRGFTYQPQQLRTHTTGALTSDGIVVLAAARLLLAEQGALPTGIDVRISGQIWDGVAWLDASWSVSSNPVRVEITEADGLGVTGSAAGESPDWYFYYIGTLESACSLSGIARLGSHHWYEEGAEALLAQQRSDGGWASPKGEARPDGLRDDLIDTCFAVLFLSRASRALARHSSRGQQPPIEGPARGSGK